jgi:hypothetical protein
MLGLLEMLCGLAPNGLAKIVRGKLRENGQLLDPVTLQNVAWAAPLALPLTPGTFPDQYAQIEVEGWLEVEDKALAQYLALTTSTEVARGRAALAPVLSALAVMLAAEEAAAAPTTTAVR